MKRHRGWIVLLAVLLSGTSVISRAEQAGSSRPDVLAAGENLRSVHLRAGGAGCGAEAELRSTDGAAQSYAQAQNPNVRRQHDPTMIVALRPLMLADQIDELAGQHVRVVNARVVGLFAPNAFLIESATTHDTALGLRDRVLVLIPGAALRIPAESIVSSTVSVVGVARTLLGMQVSGEVAWPAKLDRALIDRLEVKAGVLATSVHTADGIELTDRRSASPTPASSTRGSGACLD